MPATASTTTADTMEALVQRARAGDTAAFEQIYRRSVGRVYAICRRMAGDDTRAEELLQDVFVRVWEKLDSFRGDSAFTTWLHRLAVNVVLQAVRGDGRREARVVAMEPEDLGRLEGAASAAGTQPADRLDLERAIALLPPGARQVFVLYAIEGYRHEEIGAMLGVTSGTAKAQLHRARRLLKEALDR